jgi:hypothetical protein
MTEFEKVLQDCLLTLESGDSTVTECLSHYPNHALQLEAILLTSLDLEHGRDVRPSAAFKARVRARLTQEMRAHPRNSMRWIFMVPRLATSFAVILLALLMVGTVYAQSVLPGNAFYHWKLASENIWRLISPDSVGADLAIADRRADELISIGNNSVYRSQVLHAYWDAVTKLKSEMSDENEARIQSALDSQLEELNQSDISVPPLQPMIQPTLQPTIVPDPSEHTTTSTTIPQVNPTLAVPTTNSVDVQKAVPVISTRLPKIVPTVQVPPLLP